MAKAKSKKPKILVRVGQVYERIEHPGHFVRIKAVHASGYTVTALDQQGFRRLIPVAWILGRFRRSDFRDAVAAFEGVEPRKGPRIVEYSNTPPVIDADPDTMCNVDIDRADLTRQVHAAARVIRERDRAGLTELDKAEIVASSAPAEDLAEVYQVSPALIRRVQGAFDPPSRVGTPWTQKERAEMGRGFVSGAK